MFNPVDKLFNELCDASKDLIQKNKEFKGKLEGIEAKLEVLKPVIKKMVQSNEVLDRSRKELKGLTEVMESGKRLFVKCSKYKVWWQLYNKYKCAIELISWEKSLEDELKLLGVHTGRDVMEIAIELKENAVVLRQNAGVLKENVGVLKEIKDTLKTIDEKMDKILIQKQPGERKAWMSIEVPELPGFTCWFICRCGFG